ncbi:MAG: TlpA disulfide reductase family protein [Candidatus Marinimicrobia bacterium]|nr:TlpA disulfide reductase family protein [Candidatus Neomarinimicrobiota bacterium]
MKHFAILSVFLLFTFGWAEKNHLPKTRLKDLNNKKQELNTFYKDGPILLNFWNLACEPCKKEMKELNKIHIKYADKGFEVVSINIDNTRSMSKVKSYVNSQKYAFKVLSDPRAELFRKTGGKVMPYVLIAGKEGEIINRHVGYNPGDEKKLEEEIAILLGVDKTEDVNSPETKPSPLEEDEPAKVDSAE